MRKKLAYILACTMLLTSEWTPTAAFGADTGDIIAEEALAAAAEEADAAQMLIAEDAGDAEGTDKSSAGSAEGNMADTVISEETPQTADPEELAGLIEESAPEAEPSSSEDAFILDEDTGIIEGPVRILDPMGPADNDALFAGYVDSLFGNAGLPSLSAAEPEDYGLTGNDLLVYNAVRDAAVEIAAGRRASSVVTVSASALGVKTSYSAEELGVEDNGDGNAVWSAMGDIMYAWLDFDFNRVLDVLLVDCPYTLYWYDKTQGSSSGSCGLRYSYNGSYYASYSSEDVITISLAVCQEYAGSGDYTVDTSVTGAASKAAANAQAVVAAHRNKSDLGKLEAYRDYIINNVDYNDDAAGNNSTPFGNPWQMVWVFDEDPSTKVVCEGYSKAFKYLCDCTEFDNPTLKCLLATGTMQGGTGAGPHMWNLVTMGDRSYLVDVTNSDTGTIGSDGSLFLAGYDTVSGNSYKAGRVTYIYDSDTIALYDTATRSIHSDSLYADVDSATGRCKGEHLCGEWSTRKEASCIAEGERESVCTLCGTSVTETIPVSGMHTLTSVAAVEPTCEEPGRKAYWVCSVCGKLFADSEGTVPTAEEDLQTAPSGHAWGIPVYTWLDDNTKVSAVRACLNDEGHTETETVDAESKVTVEPGCDTSGEETWTSAAFENDAFQVQTRTVKLEPAGHELTAVAAMEPTCGEPGMKAHWVCGVCGKRFADAEGTVPAAEEDLQTAPSGHAWGEPVYTWSEDNKKVTAVRTCANDPDHVETETVDAEAKVTAEAGCDTPGEETWTSAAFENKAFSVQTKKVEIPAAGHDLDKVEAVEATCGAEGVRAHWACSVCGRLFGDEAGTVTVTEEDLKIAKTDHAWGEPVYTWSDDNMKVTAVRTCLNDESHTETETVDADLQVTTEPDCETPGEGIFTTAVFENGAFEVQSKQAAIPAAGHTWDAGTVITPATEEAEGQRIVKCTVCGHEEVETIDRVQVNITVSKKPTASKAKALKKGKVTFTWKKFKQTKKTKKIWKKIKGIEVQYSTDKTFKSGVKSKPVGKKKTSAKITGLTKGATYYFRLRYKAADGVSAWSKVKNVKVK